MPASAVLRAPRPSSTLPSAVANAKAMFGPRSGAMTMAPMMTAALSRHMPMAATRLESRIMARKTPLSWAEARTWASSSWRLMRAGPNLGCRAAACSASVGAGRGTAACTSNSSTRKPSCCP